MKRSLTATEQTVLSLLLSGYNFKTASIMTGLNETSIIFVARNIKAKLALPPLES